MQNVGDYRDFYLKTDVCLLVDVFENFRSICLKQYRLDLAYHYTSPGLSWDVILKKTGTCICSSKKGTRGGILMVSKRYAKVNNQYVKDFDPTRPNNYTQDLDENNLHGRP